MRYDRKVIWTLILLAIGGVLIWFFAPRAGPVTVIFLGYENYGSDYYATVELRNNTTSAIRYRSEGRNLTGYFWQSGDIDYAWCRNAFSYTNLPPASARVFRVGLLTPDDDWRTGIEYEFVPPKIVACLPAFLVRWA